MAAGRSRAWRRRRAGGRIVTAVPASAVMMRRFTVAAGSGRVARCAVLREAAGVVPDGARAGRARLPGPRRGRRRSACAGGHRASASSCAATPRPSARRDSSPAAVDVDVLASHRLSRVSRAGRCGGARPRRARATTLSVAVVRDDVPDLDRRRAGRVRRGAIDVPSRRRMAHACSTCRSPRRLGRDAVAACPAAIAGLTGRWRGTAVWVPGELLDPFAVLARPASIAALSAAIRRLRRRGRPRARVLRSDRGGDRSPARRTKRARPRRCAGAGSALA